MYKYFIVENIYYLYIAYSFHIFLFFFHFFQITLWNLVFWLTLSAQDFILKNEINIKILHLSNIMFGLRLFSLFFFAMIPSVLSWNQNNFYIQQIQKTNLPLKTPQNEQKHVELPSLQNWYSYKRYSSLLLHENTGLLHKIVNSFHVRSTDLKNELLQEASIEYLNALKTFDTKKNVAFNTYAYIIVRRKLASFLLQYENVGIRTPKHLQLQYYQFMKNKNSFSENSEKIYGQDKTKIMKRIGKSSPLFANDFHYKDIEDSENFLDDYFQENEQKEWINIQRKLAKRASSKYKHKKNKKKETIYETRVNIKDET